MGKGCRCKFGKKIDKVHSYTYFFPKLLQRHKILWMLYLWVRSSLIDRHKFNIEIWFFIQVYVRATILRLKELYTSISTLAQKLVLALLNNKFIIILLNWNPFRQKIRKHFDQKTVRDNFSANWVVLGLYCSYTKFYIFPLCTFLYCYTKR